MRPPVSVALAATLGLQLSMASAQSSVTLPVLANIDIPESKGKFDFLRVDVKRHRLLAAHEKDGTSDFIDLNSHKLLARLSVGPAVDTATDPESATYYVSVQDDARIAIIDAESLKETGSIKLPGPTDAIIFEPKNRMIFITHDEGKEVWVVDPKTKKLASTIVIPGVPEFLEYDALRDRIYLNIKDKNLVAVIDPNSNKVIAQWPTAPAVSPHGLAVDAEQHRLYSAGGNGKLVAFDIPSGKVLGAVDISPKVDQIAYDARDGLVYCAGLELSVVKVSGDKMTLVGDMRISPSAKNVAVDPASHAVWSTYSDGTDAHAQGWSAPPAP